MMVLELVAALAIDQLFGEPRRHPLVAFGHCVSAVETRFYRADQSARRQQFAGLLGWALLVLPPVALLWTLLSTLPNLWQSIITVLTLAFCLGGRSLGEHARAVAGPLVRGDLGTARQRVAMLVSRDTRALDEGGISRATIESVLENGNDAIFASLFWFALGGAPAALLHRLANTLDARWGYRSARYENFGRAAARLDDLLNWVPARLCALVYALVGHWLAAVRCWRAQARHAASPNGGPVMAAGAGALQIRLGGPAMYAGQRENRPILGCGREARAADIPRALALLRRGTLLWVLVIALASLLHGISA